MSSPYPWYYNFRWLIDYFTPSIKNPTDLTPLPRIAKWRDDKPVARIAFAGDLMCMQKDRIPDVAPEITAVFESADLVVVNCEAPVMFDDLRPYAKYVGHFAMAEAFLFGFLEQLGVPAERAVLSVANNHIADQATEGLQTTVERIEARGATAIGGRLEPSAALHRTVEVQGLRVALFAWSDWLNSAHRLAEGVGIFRAADIAERDFSALRDDHDLVIATPHWEYEFRHFPRAETRARAAKLLNNGVDILVGHHPHVLMPLERINNRLCLYSIGNLNGPALKNVGWPVRLGGILTVDVDQRGVIGYELHPFMQRRDEDLHVALLPLDRSAEGEMMKARLAVVAPSAP